MLGIRNWARNLWETIEDLRPSYIIPPGIWGTLRWLMIKIPQAAGFGTRKQQVYGSIVVGVTMVIASLGLLTYLAVLMLIPLFIGFARHHDTVDKYWQMVVPQWSPAVDSSLEDILG